MLQCRLRVLEPKQHHPDGLRLFISHNTLQSLFIKLKRLAVLDGRKSSIMIIRRQPSLVNVSSLSPTACGLMLQSRPRVLEPEQHHPGHPGLYLFVSNTLQRLCVQLKRLTVLR